MKKLKLNVFDADYIFLFKVMKKHVDKIINKDRLQNTVLKMVSLRKKASSRNSKSLQLDFQTYDKKDTKQNMIFNENFL